MGRFLRLAVLGIVGGTGVVAPAGPGWAAPSSCLPPATTVVRGLPWAQNLLAPGRVWPFTWGDGVTVAVLDTGVDARVPQLRDRVLPGADLTVAGGRADNDCVGHGTFVAGVVAARPASGIGFTGIAPGVRIVPVRVAAGLLAAGIRTAVDAGARVVNVSVDSWRPSADLRDAVGYATHRGALVVAAANRAADGDPPPDPEVVRAVLTVGPVGPDGQSTSDSAGPVDLVAPGVDIVSVGPGGPGHLVAGGVGYAVPFVSGVAALVMAAHPKLDPGQVKRRLEMTADHPGRALPDARLGWGTVDPYAAVTALLPDDTGWTARTDAGPGAVRVPARPVTDHRDAPVAWGFTAAAGVLAVLAGVVAVAVPRGRRRSWRASR